MAGQDTVSAEEVLQKALADFIGMTDEERQVPTYGVAVSQMMACCKLSAAAERIASALEVLAKPAVKEPNELAADFATLKMNRFVDQPAPARPVSGDVDP